MPVRSVTKAVRMFLDQDLAQEIVDRTMDVIDFNVNVMNKRCLIVGSGDSGRANTLHEGALMAITQNRKVIIDSASSRTLRGVQPGVNLPLHHQGEVIGVVGITGEPKNVEICGELLKMMVEQASSLEHSRWQLREREEFFTRVVTGELDDAA